MHALTNTVSRTLTHTHTVSHTQIDTHTHTHMHTHRRTHAICNYAPVCCCHSSVPATCCSDTPVSELSLELLLLQVVLPALLEQGHTRQWLKSLVRGWCVGVAWLLGIRSYLLGDVPLGQVSPIGLCVGGDDWIFNRWSSFRSF